MDINNSKLVDAALLAILYHPKLRDHLHDEELVHDIRIILENLKGVKQQKKGERR